MTRNFKISFPLPGKSSASPNATPGSLYSNPTNVGDSPFSHPGSKAERTLGASEPELPEPRTKLSWKGRKQLSKNPSYMNVTLSKPEGESVRTPNGYPLPGMPTPAETLPRSAPCLNRQGSSPSLVEHYTNGSTEMDYFSGLHSAPARRTGSATTLRSHYDPAKSPVSVSQHTSASSTRDMALRKGMSKTPGPVNYNAMQTAKSGDLMRTHPQSVSGDANISRNSIRRINGIPRRRPSLADPPTLYPNADRAFHALSPPPALIGPTFPKSLQHPPTTRFQGTKWWQKTPPSSGVGSQTRIPSRDRSYEDSFPSVKVNVKAPNPKAPGQRNWFDGLEDHEQQSANLQHPEVSNHLHVPKRPEPPVSIYEIMAQGPRSSQVKSRKSSFSNKSQRTAPSTRKLSFRIDPTPSRSIDSAPSTPAHGLKSLSRTPSSDSIPSTITGRVMYPGMNHHLGSFLELSSSEDDGTESSTSSKGQAHVPYRCHKIRASIERVRYDSEVLVGNAQRAQPVTPRSIETKNFKRPASARSDSSETVPTVPNVPPIPSIVEKPKVGQRGSSTRWREMMEEKATSIESTVDDREISVDGEGKTRKAPSSRTKKRGSARGSKLMKVTQEEEKLLEAMREKRASVRQDDFEKGFKTAMQWQEIVSRPKTAGADGGISRSSVSIYGSRSSNSSLLLQECAFKKTLTGSQLSASTDDLVIEDAFPFPEAPPTLKTPIGLMSPPKISPSPSFSPSNILPSTPTSRSSPITPPACVRPGISLRGSMITNKLGHERKRTTSSSVVMLDGVEQHAQELDEENAITGWAMDRW